MAKCRRGLRCSRVVTRTLFSSERLAPAPVQRRSATRTRAASEEEKTKRRRRLTLSLPFFFCGASRRGARLLSPLTPARTPLSHSHHHGALSAFFHTSALPRPHRRQAKKKRQCQAAPPSRQHPGGDLPPHPLPSPSDCTTGALRFPPTCLHAFLCSVYRPLLACSRAWPHASLHCLAAGRLRPRDAAGGAEARHRIGSRQ